MEFVPYSQRGVHPSKFVRTTMGAYYWGRARNARISPWTGNAEDNFPNEINVFEKKRDVAVMGFGGTFGEAYQACLAKLDERLDKRGWDFFEIGNGVALRNGANAQYHLTATLIKVDRRY